MIRMTVEALLLVLAVVVGYGWSARRAARRLESVTAGMRRLVQDQEAALAQARVLSTIKHPDVAPARNRRVGRPA